MQETVYFSENIYVFWVIIDAIQIYMFEQRPDVYNDYNNNNKSNTSARRSGKKKEELGHISSGPENMTS